MRGLAGRIWFSAQLSCWVKQDVEVADDLSLQEQVLQSWLCVSGAYKPFCIFLIAETKTCNDGFAEEH